LEKIGIDNKKAHPPMWIGEAAKKKMLRLLKHGNQQITVIHDKGFARINLPGLRVELNLPWITRVYHNTSFASDNCKGLPGNYPVKVGQVVDLGKGFLGEDPGNQQKVRLMAYRGKGHKVV
jgi:hypothetical protein